MTLLFGSERVRACGFEWGNSFSGFRSKLKEKAKYPVLNTEFAPAAALFLGPGGTAHADLNRDLLFLGFRSKFKGKDKYLVLNKEFAPAAALNTSLFGTARVRACGFE